MTDSHGTISDGGVVTVEPDLSAFLDIRAEVFRRAAAKANAAGRPVIVRYDGEAIARFDPVSKRPRENGARGA